MKYYRMTASTKSISRSFRGSLRFSNIEIIGGSSSMMFSKAGLPPQSLMNVHFIRMSYSSLICPWYVKSLHNLMSCITASRTRLLSKDCSFMARSGRKRRLICSLSSSSCDYFIQSSRQGLLRSLSCRSIRQLANTFIGAKYSSPITRLLGFIDVIASQLKVSGDAVGRLVLERLRFLAEGGCDITVVDNRFSFSGFLAGLTFLELKTLCALSNLLKNAFRSLTKAGLWSLAICLNVSIPIFS